MPRVLTLTLAAVLVLAAAGCDYVVRSGGESASPSDLKRWEFPFAVGDFVRVSYTEDAKANEVIAGYNVNRAHTQAAVTVYVYPAPGVTSIGSPPDVRAFAQDLVIKQHYADAKAVVLEVHTGGEVLADGPVTLRQRGADQPGYASTFRYDDRFDRRVQPVLSQLYVFRDGNWVVKYRVTYPAASEADSAKPVADFMTALAWPVR